MSFPTLNRNCRTVTCTGTNFKQEFFNRKVRGKLNAITLTFLFLAGVAVFSANAQVQNSNVPAKEGTYQLIFNTRGYESSVKLTPYQLTVIENLRQENEVVYAHSTRTDDVKVKILPRNVINAPDFKPLSLYYYKNEATYEENHNIRYVDLD